MYRRFKKSEFKPWVEIWLKRIFYRTDLWEQLPLNELTEGDELMESVAVRTLVAYVNERYALFRAQKFRKEGDFDTFCEWVVEVLGVKEEKVEDLVNASDAAWDYFYGDHEEEPLTSADRDKLLKAFLNEQSRLLSKGVFGGSTIRCKTLGQLWHFLNGRSKPSALKEMVDHSEMIYGKKIETILKSAYPVYLKKNFKLLGKSFELTPLMIMTLSFLYEIEHSNLLSTVFQLTGTARNSESSLEILAEAFDVEVSEMEEVLDVDGTFLGTSLLRYNTDPDDEPFGFLELSENIPWSLMHQKELTQKTLFERVMHEAPAPDLSLADYRHLPLVETTLLPYLRKALESGTCGVNILLYGPPGTGKTQLARLMAKELGVTLYDIECESEDPRIESWRTATTYLSRQGKALVTFDEAEDAFNEPSEPYSRSKGRRKGRIHHWLETCQVPTFWVTNSLRDMDAAMIRRFDVVLEVEPPNEEGRRRLIEARTEDRLSTSAKERLAQTSALSPAVLDRALQVVDTVGSRNVDLTDKMVLGLVSQTLRAQGYSDLPMGVKTLPEVYDPTLITSEIEPVALIEGLRSSGSGRFCLYGPPGTGKSAFAVWVAHELGLSVHRHTYGDLVSCLVGETERNIARAFRAAENAKAVLIIDEADSLFRSRSASHQLWETTQVNEMLAQLEKFEGIFFATTNLMLDFDDAALRRFDWKVPFGFMKKEARVKLALAYAEKLGFAWNERAEAKISTLEQLTPGDFMAVARQSKFRPIKDAVDWVERLAAEEAAKRRTDKQTIGFA